MQAKARAHSNIALIKYWGKRDRRLNLPATGSISLTLDALQTETSVEFSPEYQEDLIILDGAEAPAQTQKRVTNFLDLIRVTTDTNDHARVHSSNNFPTAAGLASSASGFAALAIAALAALDVSIRRSEMSRIARQGSGSAARSIFGGFVEMEKGSQPDGSDSQAHQLHSPEHLDLRLVVTVIAETAKETGSTEGMIQTERTSPFYPAWVETSEVDLKEMKSALAAKDFAKIGELSEYNCLKMHATALAARPGILYWNPGTLKAMHLVREIRDSGTPAYFTIDAGPQVKVLCPPDAAPTIEQELQSIPEVKQVITAAPGPGAHLLSE